MKLRSLAAAVLLIFALSGTLPAFAAGPVQLPAPQTQGGKPLMDTLNARKTGRAYSDKKLSEQTLSNLLWAAFGINRPDGRRTAPSAKNWQEVEIYVATPEGAYLWDPRKNTLDPMEMKDLRALTGVQPFVREAAVNLVYVADMSKVEAAGGLDQNFLVGADTGVIVENVYLFCASEGLSTVVRAGMDREALGKELKLRPQQKIILAQSVGYPKQ